MDDFNDLTENLARVYDSIAAACARANRDPAEVTLVGVSKTQPVEVILRAVEAGLQHFGENRVEEAGTKIPQVSQRVTAPITWHMVGHIQSRKAKLVPPLFQVVHSVDSTKLAEKLSSLMTGTGAILEVLLEVNISGEESKSGFEARRWETDLQVREALFQEFARVLALPGLKVRGLMTMAPIVDIMEQTRPVFAGLRQLKTAVEEVFKVSLPDLSMGMTDDYPVAIEEGATLIRVGRAIFGERRK